MNGEKLNLEPEDEGIENIVQPEEVRDFSNRPPAPNPEDVTKAAEWLKKEEEREKKPIYQHAKELATKILEDEIHRLNIVVENLEDENMLAESKEQLKNLQALHNDINESGHKPIEGELAKRIIEFMHDAEDIDRNEFNRRLDSSR